jgi:hypothetical protein
MEKEMSLRMTLLAIGVIGGGALAAASAGFAADTPAAKPAPQGQGMMGGQQGQGQGMMGGSQGQGTTGQSQSQGMMGGSQGQGMMGMMTQMTRMAENCNRMMETANNTPSALAKPPAQKTPG